MPFYEYQCTACGHHHEELQKVADRALRKCPACGRPALKRLVSAPVFRLKGAGWYETDFKSDQEGKRNIAGEKEPPAEKSKEEKPKEGKPKDEKADAKLPEKKADAAPKPVAAKKPKAAGPRVTRRRRARR